MKKIDVSIILLTLNTGEKFKKVLKVIFNQTYKNYEVILIDSSSTDNTLKYAKKYPVKIFKIQRSDFGHGKTRNLGAKLARGRYLVYLTQDAIPADNNWLTNLIVNLKTKNIAGVFGRQIPNETATPLDIFNYNEDYPMRKKIITIQNYKQSNVIYSDVNSAVKKSIILKYPYPKNDIQSEDLSWAINIIKKNYQIVYEPTAAVIHSHAYNLKMIFKVMFDQSVSYTQIFQQGNSTYLMNNNKSRFIKKMKYLINNSMFEWIFISLGIDLIKLIAVTLGNNYKRLPIFIVKKITNYPDYWK